MVYLVAQHYAELAHANQVGTTRSPDEPYIEHPRRVASLIAKQTYINEEFKRDCLTVAYLHDVLEDTDMTLDYLKENHLSQEQEAALIAITRIEGQSYLQHILDCKENPIARVVKQADLADKIGDLKPGSLKDKYELAQFILTY